MNKKIEFYDIYDYIYVPFWKRQGFLITMSVLLLLALAAGLFFCIRYYRKKQQQKVKITPWDHALQQLQTLTPEDYQTKEDFKNFYFTIASIIKRYLQKRFTLDIIEKTDKELIDYLKTLTLTTHKTKAVMFDSNIVTDLETVLNGSLSIKFANEQALRETAAKDLTTIASIIEQTKPEDGGQNSPVKK